MRSKMKPYVPTTEVAESLKLTPPSAESPCASRIVAETEDLEKNLSALKERLETLKVKLENVVIVRPLLEASPPLPLSNASILAHKLHAQNIEALNLLEFVNLLISRLDL